MRLLKIPEFWELLHCGKCATESVFFIETLQVKKLLIYHGNGKRIFGMKSIIVGNVLHIKKVQTVINNNNFCEK